jgi:hypothetical protein
LFINGFPAFQIFSVKVRACLRLLRVRRRRDEPVIVGRADRADRRGFVYSFNGIHLRIILPVLPDHPVIIFRQPFDQLPVIFNGAAGYHADGVVRPDRRE